MTAVSSTATVTTDRAARYGKQLVSHLGRRSVGVWHEDTGTGTLDMNDGSVHVAFTSTPDALEIALSSTPADVADFEDVVGRHLVRFGERDALHVRWTRTDGSPGSAQG